MAEPFLSEIRIFSFGIVPKGWALCNGQLLPINQNQALFALLGTTYGGNGETNFALPNLQGRIPIHMGAGFFLGQAGGEYAHTISNSEMPMHNHLVSASGAAASSDSPAGNLWAVSNSPAYAPLPPAVTLNAAVVSSVGGSQAHENMPPYLALNFCIALQGIFPSQN